MLQGIERTRAEVLARRAVREGKPSGKLVKEWREALGDAVVDRLLKEQGF